MDKDKKKAIVLQSNESGNQLIVYKPQNERANVVGIQMKANNLTNEIKIVDTTHERTAIWLYSTVMFVPVNKVRVSYPAGSGVQLAATDRDSYLSIDGGNILLQSSDKHHLISLQDLKDPLQEAFEIMSHDDGNFSSRWIREKGRRTACEERGYFMNELITQQQGTGLAISTETKELIHSSIANSTRKRY